MSAINVSDSKYKPVLTKRDFVKRYAAGEFGNASPTWDTFGDFLAECWMGGLFHLRNRVAGGKTYYNQTRLGAGLLWAQQECKKDWYVSAMAPEDKKIFQGEVQQMEKGLSLYYSCLPLPMREGLAKDGKQVYGIIASSLLRYYLCPNSYEWLQELLDRYPGHVVEFSTYSTMWGTLYPRFNTVFWEVRNY